MKPAEHLTDLQVVVAHPAGEAPRVEVIDKRGDPVELISLTPVEAYELAGRLASRSAQAAMHDPGS